MSSDGTLARVTYLPGVTRQSAVEPQSLPEVLPELPQEHASTVHANTVHASERNASQQRAENISTHALARRGHSRDEVAELLRSRELEPSVVEIELERLERVGLIDDAELADTIVRNAHERKGLGRAALRNELRRRRISQDVVDAALDQLDAGDEVKRALQLAERRANQFSGLDRTTAVRRLSGFLQRKGYSSDTVRQVVTKVLPQGSAGVGFR